MARIFTFNAVMIDQLLQMSDEERSGRGLTIMDIVYVPGLWAGTARAEQALYMEYLNNDSAARGGSVGMVYDTTLSVAESIQGGGFTGVGTFNAVSLVDTNRLPEMVSRSLQIFAVLPATKITGYDLVDHDSAHQAFFGGPEERNKLAYFPMIGDTQTTVHRFRTKRVSSTVDMNGALGPRMRHIVARLQSSSYRRDKKGVLLADQWDSPLSARLIGSI